MYTLTNSATFFLYKHISVTSLWLKLTIKIHTKRLWRNFSLIICLCQKNTASNVEKKNTQNWKTMPLPWSICILWNELHNFSARSLWSFNMLRLLIQGIPFACTQIKLQEFIVDLIPFLAPPIVIMWSIKVRKYLPICSLEEINRINSIWSRVYNGFIRFLPLHFTRKTFHHTRDSIFQPFRIPGIDTKESIPRNRFKGIDSSSLCSLAGRYDNPIPTWCLTSIDCSKIPSQAIKWRRLLCYSFCFCC